MKLKTASGSITLAPEDGSGDVSVTIPRAGVLSAGSNSVTDTELNSAKLNGIEAGATTDQTKADIDALGIAATSVTGSQASAITANTAKVTNYNQTKTDIDALGIAASSITGALPAIDGSALTGIDGLPTQSGQTGKYLTTNGTAASWGTVASGGVNITSNATAPSSPAVGDQWYDTTNGVLYVRVTDGTDAAWLDISSANGTAAAASGGGGAMVAIATQTVTSPVASVDFVNKITSDYTQYMVRFESVFCGTTGAYNVLQVLFSSDGGSTYVSGSWESLISRGTASTYAGTDSTVAVLGHYISSRVPSSGDATFSGLSEASKKSFYSNGVTSYDSGIGKPRFASCVGTTNTYAAVVDSIRVQITTIDMTAGTFTLYGIKNT